MPRWILSAGTLLVAGTSLLTACGGDDGQDSAPTASMSGGAAAGQALYQSEGCASCHGRNAAGAAGPAIAGLAGSEVTLKDGSTVTADREYLIRAIKDPGADVVKGYTIAMPEAGLSDAEIEQLVDYIESLG